MEKSKTIELADLIKRAGLSLKVNSENLHMSILEDLDYRYATTSLTAWILGRHEKSCTTIDLSLLSFGQFIATRPFLLPRVSKYLNTRKKEQLNFEEFLGFPRGYLKDVVFKESLHVLIAIGIMSFAKDDVRTIEIPENSNAIFLAKNLISSGRLGEEQTALSDLKSLRIPKRVLQWE